MKGVLQAHGMGERHLPVRALLGQNWAADILAVCWMVQREKSRTGRVK